MSIYYTDLSEFTLDDLWLRRYLLDEMLTRVNPVFDLLFDTDPESGIGIGYSNARAEIKHFSSFRDPVLYSLELIEDELERRIGEGNFERKT